MIIEHSDLMCEFIAFWFETRIDGKLTYKTTLDYDGLEWEIFEVEAPYTVISSGEIKKTKTIEDEDLELSRIRSLMVEQIEQHLTNRSEQ